MIKKVTCEKNNCLGHTISLEIICLLLLVVILLVVTTLLQDIWIKKQYALPNLI